MARKADVSPKSKSDIEKTISKIIDSKVDHHVPLLVAAGREHLIPVIQVPLDLPIYRIDSSRTYDSQQLKISEGIYDEELFKLPSEFTQESQQAQHDILCDMAESGGRNLFELFAKENPARDKYFIITKEGVLVNGNCRTATLREMVARGEGRPEFNHIYVAVIQEPVSRKDMTKIEMALQLKDQWQLDYDWIQLTSLILNQLRGGTSEEEVKNYWTQFDLKGRLQADYDTLMSMRAELDSYLEISEIGKEIERIRKVKGYQQLLRTFVEDTSNRKWTHEMKNEVRQFLYAQLNNAIQGISIEGRRAYDDLKDQIAEVGNHGGSGFNRLLMKEKGLKPEAPEQDSLSKLVDIGAKKPETVPLSEIAKMSKEDSADIVKLQRKITIDKKNERRDRADKKGVQRSVELAENHLGSALGFLSRKDTQYNHEGVMERINEIREILDGIEVLLK